MRKRFIREKTANFRFAIMSNIMRVITPNIRKELLEYMGNRGKMPRPFTAFLKETYGNRELTGAEIGFGFGENAKNLLDTLNIKTLFCIDPLELYMGCFGKPIVYEKKPELFNVVLSDPHVKLLKMTSNEAFRRQLLPPLNFVYVDGLHTAEQCFNDIMNGFKVAEYVGGHDFSRRYQSQVIKAVFKVAIKTGCAPSIKAPDFWFKSPAPKTVSGFGVCGFVGEYAGILNCHSSNSKK
jgi:hypothetical protein